MSSRRQTSLASAVSSPRTKASSASREHPADDLGHVRDVGPGLERRRPRESFGRLGDVHRVVADPLEVRVDPDRGHEQPQVPRHRLLGGEQVDDHLLDLELERIDLVIARDHLGSLGGVALQQGFHGRCEGRLGLGGHGEQRRLELRELVMKVAVRQLGTHPNRPVM